VEISVKFLIQGGEKMLPIPVPKKNLILISLSLLALAAMIVAFTPNTTLADEGVPIKGTFTIAFVFIESSDACGAGDTACIACTNLSGSFIEAQGIGDTSRLGALFFQVRKCLDSTSTNPSGTLTLTAPNGKDSLTATYTGAIGTADAESFQPFSAKLTFTEGTGRFLDARGSANLTGVASPNNVAFFSIDGKLEFRDRERDRD
jgi:hypothetical protein